MAQLNQQKEKIREFFSKSHTFAERVAFYKSFNQWGETRQFYLRKIAESEAIKGDFDDFQHHLFTLDQGAKDRLRATLAELGPSIKFTQDFESLAKCHAFAVLGDPSIKEIPAIREALEASWYLEKGGAQNQAHLIHVKAEQAYNQRSASRSELAAKAEAANAPLSEMETRMLDSMHKDVGKLYSQGPGEDVFPVRQLRELLITYVEMMDQRTAEFFKNEKHLTALKNRTTLKTSKRTL